MSAGFYNKLVCSVFPVKDAFSGQSVKIIIIVIVVVIIIVITNFD